MKKYGGSKMTGKGGGGIKTSFKDAIMRKGKG